MSKKLRFLIFAFLALVLLLVVGGVAYFLVQSREHVDALRNAMAALEREENDTAIELFKQVLAKDPGNEAATVKLAELYERDGNWLQSSAFWLRAANLNNLKEEYAQQALASLIRARAFRKIASTLEVRKNLTEDLDLQLLYIYSLLMSNRQRKGIELWEAIRKENPDATARTWGRLIRVTHFAADQTFDWAYQELDALRQESQPGPAQEALIAKANLCQLQRQFKDEEENLKTLAQENYFVGTPLLAEFYANHLEYPTAVDLLEEYIPKYSDARLVILLGEMLVFTSQPERLAPIADFWRTIPGQANMKVSYYLDVLQAFLRKDFEQLAKLYPPVRDQIQTPLATFIALLCDAQLSDTARLERDLRAFAAYPPLFDLRDRVHVLLLLYLQEQVQAGAPSQDLARLAETLLAVRLSDRESYTPTMVSLIAKLKNNTLSANEVSQALEEFVNDPTCLELAATFHYSRRNYAASLNYLRELEKLEGEHLSREMKRLTIANLNFLGQNDEAAEKLLQLVAEEPAQEDDGVRALLFFFANRRADDLQRLAEVIAEEPKATATRQVIDAAMMLLQGPTGRGVPAAGAAQCRKQRPALFRRTAARRRTHPARHPTARRHSTRLLRLSASLHYALQAPCPEQQLDGSDRTRPHCHPPRTRQPGGQSQPRQLPPAPRQLAPGTGERATKLLAARLARQRRTPQDLALGDGEQHPGRLRPKALHARTATLPATAGPGAG